MLKKVLTALAALVALLVVAISLRPATFHIERSVTIASPPDEVRALVNDLHAWRLWSPWEKLDPNLQRHYEGPPSGVGAKYGWRGNGRVGQGSMTITQSEPARTGLRLEFLKPMAATNTATFTFEPTDQGTRTTWAMDGTNDFFGKALQLVVDLDAALGADFERGLSALKASAEASTKTTSIAAAP